MGTHKIARIASARLNNLLYYGAYSSTIHVCNKPEATSGTCMQDATCGDSLKKDERASTRRDTCKSPPSQGLHAAQQERR